MTVVGAGLSKGLCYGGVNSKILVTTNETTVNAVDLMDKL